MCSAQLNVSEAVLPQAHSAAVLLASSFDSTQGVVSAVCGEVVKADFTIANIGSKSWPAGTTVSLIFNTPGFANLPPTSAVPQGIMPMQTIDVHIEVVTPATPGTLSAVWVLHCPESQFSAVPLPLIVEASGVQEESAHDSAVVVSSWPHEHIHEAEDNQRSDLSDILLTPAEVDLPHMEHTQIVNPNQNVHSQAIPGTDAKEICSAEEALEFGHANRDHDLVDIKTRQQSQCSPSKQKRDAARARARKRFVDKQVIDTGQCPASATVAREAEVVSIPCAPSNPSKSCPNSEQNESSLERAPLFPGATAKAEHGIAWGAQLEVKTVAMSGSEISADKSLAMRPTEVNVDILEGISVQLEVQVKTTAVNDSGMLTDESGTLPNQSSSKMLTEKEINAFEAISEQLEGKTSAISSSGISVEPLSTRLTGEDAVALGGTARSEHLSTNACPNEGFASSDAMNQVRNISIIAHVDHDKTTLADSLLGAAAAINPNKVGDQCALDTGLEAARGIMINSTAVTLHYTPEQGGVELTINLIDSPGHVDFNSEVAAALRITDGALVIVDVVEGVCVQTRKVLQQALQERVQPVLVLNKLDRLILEKQLGVDEIWLQMQAVTRHVNSIILALLPEMEEADASCYIQPVSLEQGTVCFGSGYYGWLATIDSVAKLYAYKGHASEEDSQERYKKAMSMLSGKSSDRHFKNMALKPILDLHSVAISHDTATLAQMLTKLINEDTVRKLELKKLGTTKALLRACMRSFVPAANTLLQLLAAKLPSPAKAQQARISKLLSGSTTDEIGLALYNCNPSIDAPVMCYVGKMVQIPGSKAHFALARVFSGTVRKGDVMYVCGHGIVQGNSTTARTSARVTRVVELTPQGFDVASGAPAGSVCGIFGLDSLLSKSGSISSDPAAPPLTAITQSVSPVVSCAVVSKSTTGTAKLAEALRSLSMTDPCVQCKFDRETKQHVVSCAGELHLERCIEKLREAMGDQGLQVLPVVVSHRESVLSASVSPCLAKTSNKHCRFYFVASPLDADFVEELQSSSTTSGPQVACAMSDNASRARHLVERYGWDAKHARKIVGFAPEVNPTCVLVNATEGVQYVDEVSEHLLDAFRQFCENGPLCGESVRGVRVDLVDAKIHSESSQCRASQVVPACIRGISAAVLEASPVIIEPLYSIDVTVPLQLVGKVHQVLSSRRGKVLSQEAHPGDAEMQQLAGLIPVSESIGLSAQLREKSHGQAFFSCQFDHWEILVGDVYDARSRSADAVRSIRERKRLSAEVPKASSFVDKTLRFAIRARVCRVIGFRCGPGCAIPILSHTELARCAFAGLPKKTLEFAEQPDSAAALGPWQPFQVSSLLASVHYRFATWCASLCNGASVQLLPHLYRRCAVNASCARIVEFPCSQKKNAFRKQKPRKGLDPISMNHSLLEGPVPYVQKYEFNTYASGQ